MSTQPGFDEIVLGVNAALAVARDAMAPLRAGAWRNPVSGMWFIWDGSALAPITDPRLENQK